LCRPSRSPISGKQVTAVFDALSCQIKAAVGKKGPGIFTLPGLMKSTFIQKSVTPKGKRAEIAERSLTPPGWRILRHHGSQKSWPTEFPVRSWE